MSFRGIPSQVGLFLSAILLVSIGVQNFHPFLAAQEKKPTEEKDDLDFWKEPSRSQPAAAAQLVFQRNPLIVFLLRDAGMRFSVWGNELAFPDDEVPPLNEEWLDLIEDKKAIQNLVGRPPGEIPDYEIAFHKARDRALANSFLVPAKVFAEKAKENPHIELAHLYNQPGKYRGKVIHIEGRLKRLREWDAPSGAQKIGAFQKVYEGWIFGKTPNAPPFWVLFPLKPDSIPVAESTDHGVSFDGYFLAIIRYRAGEKDRFTPILVGPTVTPLATPKPETKSDPIPVPLLIGVVGFVLVIALIILGFQFWFRRDDQKIRRLLKERQAFQSLESLENQPNSTVEDKPKNDQGYGTNPNESVSNG